MAIESITLLGSSSGRNAGDAALIGAIMDSIDETLGRKIRYEIPTINPRYIREEYANNTVPIGMMPYHASIKMLGLPTWRSINRTDLTLIFDAILFDRSLYNPLFNFLWSISKMLPAAKRKGKQIGYFNVGGGPVNTEAGKRILKDLSEHIDFITSRDPASERIFKEIGVENPRRLVTADAAVGLTPASAEEIAPIFQKIGLDPKQEIFAINVNRYIDTWADDGSRESIGIDKFTDVYAQSLDHIAEKLQVPILFVNTQHHDIEISEKIVAKMKQHTPTKFVNNKDYNHAKIKAVLGQCDLLFGMRLHANILASSAMCPIIGLAYQPKVDFYFESLGIPEYSLSFDHFTVDEVTAFLLKGWEDRHKLRGVLDDMIPKLQARAHSSAQFVKAIDEGGDLDEVLTRLQRDNP